MPQKRAKKTVRAERKIAAPKGGKGLLNLWISALTKPQETFASEKANSSVMEGLKQYAIAGAIGGFLGMLLIGITVASTAAAFGLDFTSTLLMAFNPITILTAILVSMTLYAIGSLIVVAILYAIAKVLGGKGSFTEQYYLSAIFAAPIMAIAMLLGVLTGTQLQGSLGLLWFLLQLLVAFYSIYLAILLLKEAHGFGTLKAIAVLLIPGIVLTVVTAILMLMVAPLGYVSTPR